MNTTIHNEYKKYKDLRFIAKHIALGFKDELDSEELTESLMSFAETISSQDMRGFATKGDIKALNSHIDHIYQVITQDIKEAKQSNQSDITLLTQRIDTLPDLIMWKIVKYGSVIYAGIRLVEYVLPMLLKSKGV